MSYQELLRIPRPTHTLAENGPIDHQTALSLGQWIRDRFGIYPLYFHTTDTGVVFASEPKGILATGVVRPEVGLGGLRELLSFVETPGQEILRGIRELPPGHVMVVGADGARQRRYWALEAREHRDDLPRTIATTRQLLEDSVVQQLESEVPLCTLLSGGLDSTAITALAARAQASTGTPVRTFSVDFVGYQEQFRASATHGTPDAPFVKIAVDAFATEHTRVELSSTTMAEAAVRDRILAARDFPVQSTEMFGSLYLLSRALREHSTVALCGDGADELFGGYQWFHDPGQIASPTFPWLAMAYQLQHTELLSGLLDPQIRAQLAIDEYRRDAYATALNEVPRLPGEKPSDARIREITYLNLTRYLHIILDRKDRMGMAAGVEGRVPFCDHRLVEYVFNVPWAMKTFDGREKSLLRAAVRDTVPNAVLDRTKTPFPTVRDGAYRLALREQLQTMVTDGSAPVMPYLDQNRLRALLTDRTGGAATGITRQSMEMALQLNTWLAEHGVRIVL